LIANLGLSCPKKSYFPLISKAKIILQNQTKTFHKSLQKNEESYIFLQD